MRKLFAFCICVNKGADQLPGNPVPNQGLCFQNIDSTIPLLHKSKISRLYSHHLVVQSGLCWTWSETPKTGFLVMRLIRVPFLLANTVE